MEAFCFYSFRRIFNCLIEIKLLCGWLAWKVEEPLKFWWEGFLFQREDIGMGQKLQVTVQKAYVRVRCIWIKYRSRKWNKLSSQRIKIDKNWGYKLSWTWNVKFTTIFEIRINFKVRRIRKNYKKFKDNIPTVIKETRKTFKSI